MSRKTLHYAEDERGYALCGRLDTSVRTTRVRKYVDCKSCEKKLVKRELLGLGERVLYTTRGRDRGACGHEHDSIASAHACALVDYAAAEAEGEWSDRNVVRVDRRELTQRECDELCDLEDAAATR